MRFGVAAPAFAALLLASGCVRSDTAATARYPTASQPHARRDAHNDPSRAVAPLPPGVRAPPPALLAPASPRDCYDTLWRAGVTFDIVPPEAAPGVQSPLRLHGGIGGIAIRPRQSSRVHEIIDCRLALRLLAWAPKLRRAGVRSLEHYSIYRPGARTPRDRASGHAHALAIDAARFHLVTGAVVDVLSDWEDRDRGGHPCPERPDEAWPSRLLRGVVCDAIAQGLFDIVLTPHHDAAHGNHLHLELKPDVNWTYVR